MTTDIYRDRMDAVFSDKASLVLREMLAEPGREWVVRDFVDELKLGRGWVATVMAILRKGGYLKGKARGRSAGACLRNQESLLQEWTRHYRMDQNPVEIYYSPSPDILPQLKTVLKRRGDLSAYALTLHSGANLLTNHVRDPNIYVYLAPTRFSTLVSELRLALDLKELKQGGNIYFFRPYYRASAFHNLREIQGYPVVSNIQLFLDLYHFPARGREHSEYLVRILKNQGTPLA